MSEKEVFNQEIDNDELEDVIGGAALSGPVPPGKKDSDTSNCTYCDTRNIYGGKGFPNCAGTVEAGSWCSQSDACAKNAVCYKGMSECDKTWK